MVRVVFFTQTDFCKFNDIDVEFIPFSAENIKDRYFDIAITDKTSYDIFSQNLANMQEYIYKIAIVDDKSEIDFVCKNHNAWILSTKIANIHKLIKASLDRIKIAKDLNASNKILKQVLADNNIGTKSCDLVLLNLKKATLQVKNIFEIQVEEMKNIHNDIKAVRSNLQDDFTPPICIDVQGAARQTDSILIRTDSVIKEMYGFIRILQCEDRIAQMLDGIKNLLNLEAELIRQQGIDITKNELLHLTDSLEVLFTLQEQRDIAKGETDIDKMVACGSTIDSEPEEIELF